MIDLLERSVVALLQTLNRPRVVHRLPGRLRINLPILKRLPADTRIDPGIVDRFTEEISGLRSIGVSLRTGNILLEYDEDALNEQQIFDALSKIGRAVVRYRHCFEALEKSKTPVIVNRLIEHLQHNWKTVLATEEVELPREIWT